MKVYENIAWHTDSNKYGPECLLIYLKDRSMSDDPGQGAKGPRGKALGCGLSCYVLRCIEGSPYEETQRQGPPHPRKAAKGLRKEKPRGEKRSFGGFGAQLAGSESPSKSLIL